MTAAAPFTALIPSIDGMEKLNMEVVVGEK